MRYRKRTQHKHCNTRCRVSNWHDYDRVLRIRGSMTGRCRRRRSKSWHSLPQGRPADQQLYSRMAIETAVKVRRVLHLRLRQAEGILRC